MARLLVTVAVCAPWTGPAARAETVFVAPSLSVSEEFDDNIRLTETGREADFVTAFRPGVRVEVRDLQWVRDTSWTLFAAGSVRSEVFASHSDLSAPDAAIDASIGAEARVTPNLSLTATDTFARTRTLAEGAEATFTVTPGRFASLTNTANLAATYRHDVLTTVNTHYWYRILRSEAPDARDSDTHTVDSVLERTLTPRFGGLVRYTFNRFAVADEPTRDSHAATVGVTAQLTPTIRVASENGVVWLQDVEGVYSPAWASSQRYIQDFKQARLSLYFTRAAALAGTVGSVGITQALGGMLTFQASRALSLSLDTSVTETEQSNDDEQDATGDIRVYRAALTARYQVLRWLFLEGGYQFHQQASDGPAGLDITRNVLFIRLTATGQFRVY